MTTNDMNRMELNETELDAVNGGFGWDDLKNVLNKGKKIGDKVVNVVKKEVNKVVDTVVEGAETVVEVIKKVNPTTTINPLPGNPLKNIK